MKEPRPGKQVLSANRMALCQLRSRKQGKVLILDDRSSIIDLNFFSLLFMLLSQGMLEHREF